MEPADQRPPLRSNARRNRDRILEVAHEVLTANHDASLNSIAKQAGVGIATLYRHFPSREALVLAVYRHEVQQLADLAARLLAKHDPLTALRWWLNRFAQDGMQKAELGHAWQAAGTTHDDLAAESYGPIVGALTSLLQANVDAGTIRSDLDPDDVLLMLGFLRRLDPRTEWQPRAARMLDVFMDGLTAPSAERNG